VKSSAANGIACAVDGLGSCFEPGSMLLLNPAGLETDSNYTDLNGAEG